MNGKMACVEVWYNRQERSWVVQHYTSDGWSAGSDYVYTKQEAISAANSYNVPVVFTTPEGGRK